MHVRPGDRKLLRALERERSRRPAARSGVVARLAEALDELHPGAFGVLTQRPLKRAPGVAARRRAPASEQERVGAARDAVERVEVAEALLGLRHAACCGCPAARACRGPPGSSNGTAGRFGKIDRNGSCGSGLQALRAALSRPARPAAAAGRDLAAAGAGQGNSAAPAARPLPRKRRLPIRPRPSPSLSVTPGILVRWAEVTADVGRDRGSRQTVYGLTHLSSRARSAPGNRPPRPRPGKGA